MSWTLLSVERSNFKGKQGETADPFNFQNTRIIPSLTVSMHKVFHCTYMWIHLHYGKIPPAPIFHSPNSFTPFFPCITHFSSPIYSVGPVQLHPAPPLSYKPLILHLLSSHTHPALTFTAEGGEETVWRGKKEVIAYCHVVFIIRSLPISWFRWSQADHKDHN